MVPTKLGDLKSPKKLLELISTSYTKYRAIAFNVKENQNVLSFV